MIIQSILNEVALNLAIVLIVGLCAFTLGWLVGKLSKNEPVKKTRYFVN